MVGKEGRERRKEGRKEAKQASKEGRKEAMAPSYGTLPWHPAMAPDHGNLPWHLTMTPHQWHTMAPYHGTLPSPPTKAPSNGTPTKTPPNKVGSQPPSYRKFLSSLDETCGPMGFAKTIPDILDGFLCPVIAAAHRKYNLFDGTMTHF